jgi:hypothetical protein
MCITLHTYAIIMQASSRNALSQMAASILYRAFFYFVRGGDEHTMEDIYAYMLNGVTLANVRTYAFFVRGKVFVVATSRASRRM